VPLLYHDGFSAAAEDDRPPRLAGNGNPGLEEQMPMILHVFPPSPRALRVLALANHLKLNHETKIVDLGQGGQNRPEYAALNPNKRMPVLEDDGFVLWESNAILVYLAAKSGDRSLWPADPKGQADVVRWLSWEGAHWTPAGVPIVYERVVKAMMGQGGPDLAVIEKALPEFHRVAAILNDHLKGRKWLTGANLTVADFSVGSTMSMAATAHLPMENYGEINRWYGALAALPGWRAAQAGPPAQS
jgi:glutathione S-transferase